MINFIQLFIFLYTYIVKEDNNNFKKVFQIFDYFIFFSKRRILNENIIITYK